ncbi:MAG TPA: hypothetical protein VGW38_06230 [Chloroflexota bacterium]|nr:hypothetical protein [Chloroflexota bacterium]
MEEKAQRMMLRIDPRSVLGRVPDTLFGWQHGEVADPIFRGLWAELLANRKFGGHDSPAAGQQPSTVRAYIRANVFHEFLADNPQPAAFGVVNPWYAIGSDESTYFCHDNTTFYTGGQSQRIEIHPNTATSSVDQWHGVAQAGLLIRSAPYTVRLVACTEGIEALRVRLLDTSKPQRELASAQAEIPGSGWEAQELTLRPQTGAENAAFHVEARGAGTLWLGAVSLMAADHVDGFRPDVLSAVRALQPTVIRWGGNTTQYYRWRSGVGPRDRRAPFMDAWDSLLSHDFGTHEFVQYCRLVGAEPLICANAGNAPEEAAEWVEYCNAPAHRGLGRLRAEHGALEPFGVRLWSLGNEVYGNWVVGHCDPETYGRRARAMGEAMKRADPEVKVLLVGNAKDREWNRRMLRHAGSIGDFLSLHYYPRVRTSVAAGDNASPRLAGAEEAKALHQVVASAATLERVLLEAREDMAALGPALPHGPLPVALDEWSLMLAGGDDPQRERWGRLKDMRDALFVGSAFNHLQRRPDLVGLSTYTRLHRYGLYTHQGGSFASPDVLSIGLMSARVQSLAVATTLIPHPAVAGASAVAPGGPTGDVPAIDAAATMSEDERTIAVCLVNPDPTRSVAVEIHVDGRSETRLTDLQRVHGRSFVDANTREQPNAVRVEAIAVPMDGLLHLPPASISVVTLDAR